MFGRHIIMGLHDLVDLHKQLCYCMHKYVQVIKIHS